MEHCSEPLVWCYSRRHPGLLEQEVTIFGQRAELDILIGHVATCQSEGNLALWRPGHTVHILHSVWHRHIRLTVTVIWDYTGVEGEQ